MFDSPIRKIFIGAVTGAMLATAVVSVSAAEDKPQSYNVVDSQGKPVLLTRDKECLTAPASPNTPTQSFPECGGAVERSVKGCPTTCYKLSSITPDLKKKLLETYAESCFLDDDNDDVPNYCDKCPGTKKGAKVEADGCEIVKREAPVTVDDIVILSGDVTFAFGKFNLTPQGKKALDGVAKKILASGDRVVSVTIVGHTDSVGSEKGNMTLSQKRAGSVKTYLVSKGVPASKVIAKGEGKTKPRATNKTKQGRAQNRRVEIDIKTTK